VCKLSCQSGAYLASNGSEAPSGVFSPPYAINNGAARLPLGTKVGAPRPSC